MNDPDNDKVFTGSIPTIYQEYLVPLLFEPYAADLADRMTSRPVSRILELAAGTGVATRRLASVLPESVSIVATDLNQEMLDVASEIGTPRPVQWRQADALQLPFEDGEFDAVVCQFGIMFLPDKTAAFVARRPRGCRRSRTAKARRCATRSRPAAGRGSVKRPTSRRRQSPNGSGPVRWTAGFRRTSLRSNADCLGYEAVGVSVAQP